MEQERNDRMVESGYPEERKPEEWAGPDPVERDEGYRTRPTWRGLLIAVIAAVVLSVGATLLLGGSYGFTRQGAASGCGAGAAGDCCAPSERR